MKEIRAMLLMLLMCCAAATECDGGGEERDKGKALKYKVAAIASILIAGAIGVCLPVIGNSVPALRSDQAAFLVIKAFAAGVILATAFVHIMPDAFDSLTSPCLSARPWTDFPFAGFVAMLAAIATLMVDTYATSYYAKSCKVVDEEDDPGNLRNNADSSEILRRRVVSQVLELGIVVHSVVIGISLGASGNAKTIKPLVAALSCHQFFEGMGLGGCITQAEFSARSAALMALFFSLTTPAGVAIGIGVSRAYDENSPKALIVEGVLNSASAGILIYMALVDLLAEDFLGPRMRSSWKLRFGANVGLLLGAGCMSVLAKWA